MTDYEYIVQQVKKFHYSGRNDEELRKCVDMLPGLTREQQLSLYWNRATCFYPRMQREPWWNYDNISNVLETIWPGLWNAVQAIINPRLDKYVMNDREKEIVRKVLGDKPKERLANAGWMLKAVDAIRDIAVGTKAEVYRFFAVTNGAITDSQNNNLPVNSGILKLSRNGGFYSIRTEYWGHLETAMYLCIVKKIMPIDGKGGKMLIKEYLLF